MMAALRALVLFVVLLSTALVFGACNLESGGTALTFGGDASPDVAPGGPVFVITPVRGLRTTEAGGTATGSCLPNQA